MSDPNSNSDEDVQDQANLLFVSRILSIKYIKYLNFQLSSFVHREDMKVIWWMEGNHDIEQFECKQPNCINTFTDFMAKEYTHIMKIASM
jgi:hypothetical protein